MVHVRGLRKEDWMGLPEIRGSWFQEEERRFRERIVELLSMFGVVSEGRLRSFKKQRLL